MRVTLYGIVSDAGTSLPSLIVSEHLIEMALTVILLAFGLASLRSCYSRSTATDCEGAPEKSKQCFSESPVDTMDIPVMEEKGNALTLLIDAWVKLAPVLAPVMLIIVFNNRDAFHEQDLRQHSFIMNCAHNTDVVAALCSFSRPWVRLFPVWVAVVGVLMGAWKMLYTRAYYVLMKHRIMVTFPQKQRLGFKLGVVVSLIYSLVIFHFTLLLLYDWPCDDENTCGNERFLNNTIMELVTNPALLTSNKNQYFVPMAKKFVMQYLVPGALALAFLFNMDNFVELLVSMDVYFQKDAYQRYGALGDFVVVTEPVAKQVVIAMLEQDTPVTDISQACQIFKSIAMDHGCGYLGTGKPITHDKARSSCKDAANQEHAGACTRTCKAIQHLILLDWWPAKLLMSFNLEDEESRTFKKAIVGYLSQAIIIIVIMAVLTLRRFILLALGDGLNLKNGFDNRAFDRIFEAAIPAMSLALLIIILSSVVLHMLGHNFCLRRAASGA